MLKQQIKNKTICLTHNTLKKQFSNNNERFDQITHNLVRSHYGCSQRTLKKQKLDIPYLKLMKIVKNCQKLSQLVNLGVKVLMFLRPQKVKRILRMFFWFLLNEHYNQISLIFSPPKWQVIYPRANVLGSFVDFIPQQCNLDLRRRRKGIRIQAIFISTIGQ